MTTPPDPTASMSVLVEEHPRALGLLARARRSLRHRRLAETLRLAVKWGAFKFAPGFANRIENGLSRWLELRYDRRRGLDTESAQLAPATDTPASSREHGTKYEATDTATFRAILRTLAIDPAEFTFLDLGCGKGKLLFLASELGFRRVVGVEHSESLAQVAALNMQRHAEAKPQATPIELVHGDAGAVEPPTGPLVIYMFNPFGAPVMRRVLERVRESLEREPRDVRLVYLNPRAAEVFEATDWLVERARGEGILRGTYRVYAPV